MIIHPPYLCKYKYLPQEAKTEDQKQELDRTLEVLKESKIHISSFNDLNDPIEAAAVYVRPFAAGSGYQAQLGILNSQVEGKLENFKILSLSATASSFAMWAHYANNFHGLCYIFDSNKTFSNVQPVIYIKKHFEFCESNFPAEMAEPIVGGHDIFDDIVAETLLFKEMEWNYECEWRLIQSTKNTYVKFNDKELVAVIVGKDVNEEILKDIQNLCEKRKIPCIKQITAPGFGSMSFYPSNLSEEKVIELQGVPFQERGYIWEGEYPIFLDYVT